jgi:hypothetical protein
MHPGSRIKRLEGLHCARLGDGLSFGFPGFEVHFDHFFAIVDRFFTGFAMGAGYDDAIAEFGNRDEEKLIFFGPLEKKAVVIHLLRYTSRRCLHCKINTTSRLS